MGFIVLAAAAGIVWWAWKRGDIRTLRMADVAAVVALLIGLQFLRKGQPVPAFIALGGAGWWAWRRRTAVPAVVAMGDVEASRLLEVPLNASPDEIRLAHRRLVTRVHPDAGGSAELAARVNAARDALLARSRMNP